MNLEKKQPQEFGHIEKWTVVVEDIRKGGQAWQEIQNK